MVTPPFLLRSASPRPPAWHRWVLNALYNFERYTIADWVDLIGDHLQRPGGATPMQTAPTPMMPSDTSAHSDWRSGSFPHAATRQPDPH